MPKKNASKKTASARGKAIAAHRQKHGDSADWKKLFTKLGKKK